MTGTIHIGTSGWAYAHWRGPFYPPDLPERALLEYYCRHFRCVEINSSFYHLPGEHAVERWRDTVPAGFLFAAKASRYITHMKKLKDPQQGVAAFLGRITRLGDKLGPILFQLPPRWRCNPERLESLLEILDPEHRYAFEFRDPSWINEEVLELLRRHGAAFCIFELAGYRSPLQVTTDLVYIRLHGPAGAYQGCYDQQSLEKWAERIIGWSMNGREVFCFFDNDEAGYAVANARELQALVETNRRAEKPTHNG